MSRFTDFFWPTLERPSREDQEDAEMALEADIKSIAAIAASDANGLLLLDEARRLNDDESTTRSSVEARGGIYLATIGALIPIVIFVADALTGDSVPLPVSIAKIVLSLIAIAYLVGALRWSFKALSVGTYHRVGVRDVPTIAATADPALSLTKELLEAHRRNRPAINAKVTAIKMAELFMWRSIMVLLALLAASQVPSGIVGNLLGLEQEQMVACALDAGATDVSPRRHRSNARNWARTS